MPHHLRAYEESEYREGVVLDRKSASGASLASIGLRKDCELDKNDLEAGLRVTVKIVSESKKVIKGRDIKVSWEKQVSNVSSPIWPCPLRLRSCSTEIFVCSRVSQKEW